MNVKTAVTLICLGFILVAVSLPLYLGKIKMNYLYGFRIRKAFESEKNWYLINQYGAKAMMAWSVVLVIVGIACLYIESQWVLVVANICFLSILIPIMQTVWYAKKI
ncbi:SdpI family protein [Desulfomonile tiedjei]|uniref:SdpI family protein n=1 Tax=Desulfomonile tiedjei TaxID=2358 RepID=UPI001F2EBD17|nr:SdpI family protein [Desulfomonile tiedjei]